MQTITLTLDDYQLAALQSGQSITIEPPKSCIAKWEPKIGLHKAILEISYGETKQQLKSIVDPLKAYARQLAWLAENDDGWAADWNNKCQRKYCISFNNALKKYMYEVYAESNFINCIFMSQDNAKKLCKLLNDGIVSF